MSVEAIKILDAIKQLSFSEKLYVIELIFRDIREEAESGGKEEEKRRKAAAILLADYQEDEELTAFITLDQEDFHEAK
ncbi:MAG: hypothetical protein J5I98_15080 [Phaeodactylibacter sp.]|nr:hypothetical protein [Phaeodactylibacter sp.]